MIHILGLTGYAGAGKDTVADLLVTHARFRKMAFADALRAEIAEGFGLVPDDLARPHTKNTPTAALRMRNAPRDFLAAVVLSLSAAAPDHRTPLSAEWLDADRSPRQVMQWWGTEYRRAQHPNYWTRALLSRLTEARRGGAQRFVITDVRFDNEADALRGAGGVLWQITRPGAAGQTEGAHVSATDGARFKPDAVIANVHDVRHLQGVVLTEFLSRDLGIPAGRINLTVTA
ncbi:deoxynucleotide monophosphate kinase family protein [Variovorax atrisoli]|uniref:deoxynucleotide monophosphate kinase family protein n=1 Tax=Variovorax atrisoli TaxID=3394203 RepID=UPI001617F1F1|nr:hypothetical protein [Variovorax sp. BK613]MBB3642581.1 hypothetical protein [Variovorax sp. BK613]